MSGKIVQLRKVKKYRNATSRSKGRQRNDAYRVREHLTEAEMDRLLDALRRNRHAHRDWLVGLVIYRHGLRVSEVCDLRWDDIDLRKRTIIVRRLKGSTDSVHYLERDEVNGLKLLQRQQRADRIKGAYVFINERGQPFVASCAEWSRISVPICAKVEHWCHSPSDQIGAEIVSTLAPSGLVLLEPRPSADTRENQIGIDFDRFLSPS